VDVPHPHLLKGGVDESGVDESPPSPAQVPRPQAAQAWLPCTRACVCMDTLIGLLCSSLAGGCCNLLAKTWQPLAFTEAQLCSQRNTGIDDQDCMQTRRNHSTQGCLREGRPDRPWQSKRRISLWTLHNPGAQERLPEVCGTLAFNDYVCMQTLRNLGTQGCLREGRPDRPWQSRGASLSLWTLRNPRRLPEVCGCHSPQNPVPVVGNPSFSGLGACQKHSSQHAQANARQVHAIASTFDLLALAQHAHVFHVDVRRLCGEG